MRILLLSVLLFLANAAFAVTIEHYDSLNCRGNSRYCSGIPHHRCCQDSGPFSSSKFRGLPETAIGVACTRVGTNLCGKNHEAVNGDSACANRRTPLGLRGSYWLHCFLCIITRDISTDGTGLHEFAENIENIDAIRGDGILEEVMVDKIMIDGHMFDINHHVPQDATDMLYALADAGAAYDSLSPEALEWEVDEVTMTRVLAGE